MHSRSVHSLDDLAPIQLESIQLHETHINHDTERPRLCWQAVQDSNKDKLRMYNRRCNVVYSWTAYCRRQSCISKKCKELFMHRFQHFQICNEKDFSI